MTRLVIALLVACATVTGAVAQNASKPSLDSKGTISTLEQLETRLRNLSPGDRSIIVQAAARRGSTMMTTPGSANDALWSDMESMGWTKRETPPDGVAHMVRVYVLTEAGAHAVNAIIYKKNP